MTIARALLVDRSVCGFYHCISRCVRGAFLCGQECSHRKAWIRNRLVHLADAFAIDVGGYAILDNHFHLVLRTHPERAEHWSSHQVVRRWFRVFPASIRRWALEIELVRGERGRCDSGVADDRSAIRIVAGQPDRVAEIRDRLSDLSWFMRCLKEQIARTANREDGCRGHFWESRFKSLRILGSAGLLATLIYVDLNVIRALLAQTPETSDYTSAQDRIHVRQLYEKLMGRRKKAPRRAAALLRGRGTGSREGQRVTMRSPEDRIWLAPIDGRTHLDGMLDMRLDEFLVGLDVSGRIIRDDKPGAIPPDLPPILERLNIDIENWVEILRDVGGLFGTMIGGPTERQEEASRRGVSRVVSAFDVQHARRT